MGTSASPLIAFTPTVRPVAAARFSILIPTWNNLPYLRLCVESIRRNSAFPHQVVVHVSDGSDGTLDWVRSEGIEHTWARQNAGVSLGLEYGGLPRPDRLHRLHERRHVRPPGMGP